jgi:hypothetical protein
LSVTVPIIFTDRVGDEKNALGIEIETIARTMTSEIPIAINNSVPTTSDTAYSEDCFFV